MRPNLAREVLPPKDRWWTTNPQFVHSILRTYCSCGLLLASTTRCTSYLLLSLSCVHKRISIPFSLPGLEVVGLSGEERKHSALRLVFVSSPSHLQVALSPRTSFSIQFLSMDGSQTDSHLRRSGIGCPQIWHSFLGGLM
jgi:hypothetical protein